MHSLPFLLITSPSTFTSSFRFNKKGKTRTTYEESNRIPENYDHKCTYPWHHTFHAQSMHWDTQLRPVPIQQRLQWVKRSLWWASSFSFLAFVSFRFVYRFVSIRSRNLKRVLDFFFVLPWSISECNESRHFGFEFGLLISRICINSV